MHIYRILLILFPCTFALVNSATNLSNLFKMCLNSKGVFTSGFSYVERSNNSEIYQNLNYQWNSRQGTITPLGYFLPNGRRDVQFAIRCARKLGIRTVAKSGGHSYTKYSFGDSNSLVIDLRRMSKISIDPSALQVRVGAGTLIGQLYWALWTNGKFGISGPTCIGTGVSGVTLGGGFGHWSKKFGLMADNVVSMEFVSPSGKFLVLNETSNADLFWAMRGVGGGNFGIVTQFTFKIFNASASLKNHFSLDYENKVGKFKKVFDAFQKFAAETQEDATIVVFNGHQSSLNIGVIDGNLTLLELKNKLASFGLPEQDLLKNTSKLQLNFIEGVVTSSIPKVTNVFQLSQVRRNDSGRQYFRAKSYFLNKLVRPEQIQILEPLFLQMPKDVLVQIHGEGGAINKVPRTATAFVHRNSLLTIQVCIYDENKIIDEWVKRFDQIIGANVKESYQNYIDEEMIQNGEYLKHYYGENLAKLIRIKGEIDPDDYFKFPMSIPLEMPK